jgi:hypothetical protein
MALKIIKCAVEPGIYEIIELAAETIVYSKEGLKIIARFQLSRST